MADIFVSYKQEEKEAASKLATALEKDGWSVWWDVNIPTGSNFEVLIKETLGTCKVTIVLWSKESVKSDWVRAEAEYARKNTKVFPVRIDDVKDNDLPLLFQRVHTCDLSGWSGRSTETEYKDFRKDLVALLGDPKSPEVRELEEKLDNAQHEIEEYKKRLRTPVEKIFPWAIAAFFIAVGGIYIGTRQDAQLLQEESSIVFHYNIIFPKDSYPKDLADTDIEVHVKRKGYGEWISHKFFKKIPGHGGIMISVNDIYPQDTLYISAKYLNDEWETETSVTVPVDHLELRPGHQRGVFR